MAATTSMPQMTGMVASAAALLRAASPTRPAAARPRPPSVSTPSHHMQTSSPHGIGNWPMPDSDVDVDDGDSDELGSAVSSGTTAGPPAARPPQPSRGSSELPEANANTNAARNAAPNARRGSSGSNSSSSAWSDSSHSGDIRNGVVDTIVSKIRSRRLAAVDAAVSGTASSKTAKSACDGSAAVALRRDRDACDAAAPETRTPTISDIRVMLHESQSVALNLKAVMSSPVGISTDRGLSMTSLASQLNDIFRRQHSVNQLQFTLGSVNYLVNVFNFTQNIHLQNSVKRGQAEIDELTFVIGQLKTEIESLNLDVEDQRQASIRLRSQLATLQDVLSRTTREHRRELTVHRKMIDKQETLIAKMVRLRAHQDLLADTIVAVLALGISRLLPVGSALRMVTHMALQPSRQRTMVRRGLHVAVYLAIVLRLRSWFVACGLHSTGRTDDDHQDSRRGLSQSAAVVLLRPFWIAHSLVHGIVRTAASAVSAVVRR